MRWTPTIKPTPWPELENSLDRAYYANITSLSIPNSKADELFITFVRREIDFTNLRTLFRLKRAGMESDKIMGYLLPGGAKLRLDDLRKLARRRASRSSYRC